MSMIKSAQQLINMGFHVFPIIQNDKTPYLKNFTEAAMSDTSKLETFWWDSVMEREHYHNIGIATSKYKEGQALLVVDVDNKDGKEGSKTLLELEMKGLTFPTTLTQKTPSNGLHLIYTVDTPLKQGVDVLGPGLDIRSRGGYILGAGSVLNDKPYVFDSTQGREPVPAPKWLVDKIVEESKHKDREIKENKDKESKISQKAAATRAIDYLKHTAPVAVEGAGGDNTTFMVATRLKDIGLSQKNALTLLLEHWNENCQPPWDPDQLEDKVHNAYAYGQNSIGIDSPENEFEVIETKPEDLYDPIEALNNEFAFLVLGGKSTILHQNALGEVNYMGTQAFHDLLKGEKIVTGNGKKQQISHMWFSSLKRATYSAVDLSPEQPVPHGVYNLWRGWTVTPTDLEKDIITDDMREGVRLFKEHALENVCQGDEKLYTWLMGYFAHLVQKPWEKPLTALVFKGRKGVGKNALIERIGKLLGGHFLVTANRRYITGQFNKHISAALMFVLDEAFWSGDKQAEGILKDLITGQHHLIEMKGREMYTTKNLTRIVIVGNEEWVVPATEDERRFAVFNVGEGKRRNKPYFIRMRQLLEDKDGLKLLMRELLDFDLDSVDINEAPETEGLIDQKLASLNPIHAWWYSSLKEGEILDLDFNQDVWPKTVGRDALRSAFSTHAKKRGVVKWLPDASGFGKELSKCASGLQNRRVQQSESRVRVYVLPTLHDARVDFERFIGHKLVWEDEGDLAYVDSSHDIFS